MDRFRHSDFLERTSLSLLNITRQGFMYEKYNAAKPGEGAVEVVNTSRRREESSLDMS